MTPHWLAPEIVQRFAGSLLHFLWQGAAVGLAAAICLRLLARRSAELRHIVAVADSQYKRRGHCTRHKSPQRTLSHLLQ